MKIDAVRLRELKLAITISTAWRFNIHLGLHASFASPSLYLTLKPKAVTGFHHFIFAIKNVSTSFFLHSILPMRDNFLFPFFPSHFYPLPIFSFLFHYTNHTPLHSLKTLRYGQVKSAPITRETCDSNCINSACIATCAL